MGRKKNPDNNYFNQAVEDAVCTYIHSDSWTERERAFKVVYPAFSKIAEVMCNKMKMSYFDTTKEDFIADAVTFMVQKMDKFDCTAGKKAFSYFTVVCKHYLIVQNNKNHLHFKRWNPISEMGENFDVLNEHIERDKEIKEAADLLKAFTSYLQTNFDSVFDYSTKSFGTMVLEKLHNWENIEDINKNKIFNEIFENSNYSRGRITKMQNNLIAQYNLFKARWDTGNTSLEYIEKNFLTDEEKKYIRAEYKPIQQTGSRSTGMVRMAKKFGVTEYVVRDYIRSFT